MDTSEPVSTPPAEPARPELRGEVIPSGFLALIEYPPAVRERALGVMLRLMDGGVEREQAAGGACWEAEIDPVSADVLEGTTEWDMLAIHRLFGPRERQLLEAMAIGLEISQTQALVYSIKYACMFGQIPGIKVRQDSHSEQES